MITRINMLLAPIENIVRQYRRYIGYAILLLALLVPFFLFGQEMLKSSGEKAVLVLWIILWMPILARVFGLRIFAQMLPLRQELGILMGVLAVVHGFSYLIPYGETMQLVVDGQPSFLLFGIIAMWLSVPLTLTSSKWAMRKMGKKWKILHRLVYIIIILVVVHVVVLKFARHFEIAPVIFLVLYFTCKVLEWCGFSLLKDENKTYPIGQKWLCVPCGYVYDPVIGDADSSIVAGTEFSDIPDGWRCPVCGVTKSDFVPYDTLVERATFPAHVVQTKYLNATTLELIIETVDAVTYQVGQFTSFVWHDEQGEFTRQYSIAKQDGRKLTFLIKITEFGRGSRVLSTLSIGTEVRISGVFGTFHLQESQNPKIFIATGTGLAPIYAMICSLPIDQRGSLYFTAATALDLFYVDELRAIEGLDIHIHTTREQVLGYEFGRVDVDMIPATPETEWYFCGNPHMVSEAVAKLTTKEYTRIYREEF